MGEIRITVKVMEQIKKTLGKYPPECGGVLGAGKDGVISAFYFDAEGKSTPTGYSPNVASINELLANDWMPNGILMIGIVHSHANGINVPSCMDVGYGIRILQALDAVEEFHLPIVTMVDDTFSMAWFTIKSDGNGQYICQKNHFSVMS